MAKTQPPNIAPDPVLEHAEAVTTALRAGRDVSSAALLALAADCVRLSLSGLHRAQDDATATLVHELVAVPLARLTAPDSVHADALARASVSLRPLPTVLIVEDENDVRVLLGAVLEDDGFRVIACSDGQSALAAFGRRADIDVVVTDWVMPGMNGLALATALRQIRPNVPIIYTTGYAAELAAAGDRPEGLILTKPYRPSQIIDAIRAALQPAIPTR